MVGIWSSDQRDSSPPEAEIAAGTRSKWAEENPAACSWSARDIFAGKAESIKVI